MTKARMVYVDCSPLMRSVLDEIGPPAGMKVFDGDPSPGELAALVADAAIVLNGHTMMDDALLAQAPQLRSIVFLGTGAASYVNLTAAERLVQPHSRWLIDDNPIPSAAFRGDWQRSHGTMMASGDDNIRAPRRRALKGASAVLPDGGVIDCVLRDLSDAGARLFSRP